MDIGRQIKIARDARRMSQAALAAAVGVSTATVIRYEQGRTHPTGRTLAQVAQVLGVSIDQLAAGGPGPASGEAVSPRSNPALARLLHVARRLDARSVRVVLSVAEALGRKATRPTAPRRARSR